jgi:hypothetical protein
VCFVTHIVTDSDYILTLVSIPFADKNLVDAQKYISLFHLSFSTSRSITMSTGLCSACNADSALLRCYWCNKMYCARCLRLEDDEGEPLHFCFRCSINLALIDNPSELTMAVMVDDSESENEDVEIEDVEIEDLSKVTFRNHAKGHGFGLEQDQVQPTPKLQTSI